MYPLSFHTNDISKSSFLVTGGAGFIGSNLAEYLLQHGAGKVVVLDNLATGFASNIRPFYRMKNFVFMEGDICDLQTVYTACQGIDYVFHLAALGSVPRSIANP